jgi:peptidoglycan lytic transglycosylase G
MAFGGRRDSSQRSAEDRERAAAERAARRSGRPLPDPSPVVVEEPPEEEVTAVGDPPPPPRRVPASRRPAPRRPRTPGSRHWGRRIIALLALAAIGVALYVINATFQPFHGDGSGAVRVKVPNGADAGQIGDILEAQGVVDSGRFFMLNATLTGRRGGLRPGNYTLRLGMTNGEAIDALTKGPKAKVVKTTNMTIPEGPSIREEAPKIDKTSLTGSYAKAANAPGVLKAIRKLGAPKGTRTAEGFMFPATYTLVEGSPVNNLVAKQLGAFKQNFGSVDLSYARRKNLTRYDVLIIASLVEREAQLDRERPLIASVIYNRLRDGTPLGIDATIRYETQNWARPIRQSQLDRDTPYNSRLRRGLPPTPIGNPGLKSMRAAAKPARTKYLFFVRKPGKSGEHAFSTNNADFERDNARYQASRP